IWKHRSRLDVLQSFMSHPDLATDISGNEPSFLERLAEVPDRLGCSFNLFWTPERALDRRICNVPAAGRNPPSATRHEFCRSSARHTLERLGVGDQEFTGSGVRRSGRKRPLLYLLLLLDLFLRRAVYPNVGFHWVETLAPEPRHIRHTV